MDDFENEMDDDVEKINNFIIEKGLECDGREFYECYKSDELSISKAPPKGSSAFDVDGFFEAAPA